MTARANPLGRFVMLLCLVAAAAQVGADCRVPLGARWFVSAETRLTGAWARVPVTNGSADLPSLALHGLVGAGFLS